jgi:choline-sulfatase
MQAKRAVLGGAIVVLGAAAVLSLILARQNAPKQFYRLESRELFCENGHFEVDKKKSQIYLNEDGKKKLLEELPSGQCGHFNLEGMRRIEIAPKLSGRIGFYTYLYLQARPQEGGIEFVLEISRRGKEREILRMKAPRISRPLFQELEVVPGDRIVMSFSGRGIVYYSRPILYEKYTTALAARRTNVIVVAADTLRGDQLGNGGPGAGLELTENLRRFAQDAVCLENAYAQTSWTLPSFMSLFTALNEYHHGVGPTSPLRPDLTYLVENLSRKFITFGYHGGLKPSNGFARGFDSYQELLETTPPYPQGGKSLFEKALQTLRDSQFPQLFLFLHTYQLHSPYNPPAEFLQRLNPNPRFIDLKAVNSGQPAKTYLPVDDGLRKSLKELYQAEVLAFDSYFGDFIASLKEMDLYDSSLIVFMSDHGEEFFEHHGWAHSQSLYNELIKVPLIIKFPGSRFRGTRLADPVGVVDIMPTILSFYDLAYDAARLDGKDLLPLIRSGEKIRRDYVVSTMCSGKYLEYLPTRIALISDRYKLIYNEPHTMASLEFFGAFAPPWQPGLLELYDLQADPGETENLIHRRPGIGREMLTHLWRIRKIINQKTAGNAPQALNEETQKQLEALGYL